MPGLNEWKNIISFSVFKIMTKHNISLKTQGDDLSSPSLLLAACLPQLVWPWWPGIIPSFWLLSLNASIFILLVSLLLNQLIFLCFLVLSSLLEAFWVHRLCGVLLIFQIDLQPIECITGSEMKTKDHFEQVKFWTVANEWICCSVLLDAPHERLHEWDEVGRGQLQDAQRGHWQNRQWQALLFHLLPVVCILLPHAGLYIYIACILLFKSSQMDLFLSRRPASQLPGWSGKV